MTTGNRDKVLAPIRVDDDEETRLCAAADLDRLPLATWLRNLGLKRADELGVEAKPSKKRAAR